MRAAADAVRDQILQIAASELEIDPGDLEVADGTLSPRGVPSRGIPLTSVAKKTSGFGAPSLPSVPAPRRYRQISHPPSASTLPTWKEAGIPTPGGSGHRPRQRPGCAGHAINPSLCEVESGRGRRSGCRVGAVEQLVHDESGQLITASFLNYAIPRMETMPRVSTVIVEVRSRHGPFGAKGIGEIHGGSRRGSHRQRHRGGDQVSTCASCL